MKVTVTKLSETQRKDGCYIREGEFKDTLSLLILNGRNMTEVTFGPEGVYMNSKRVPLGRKLPHLQDSSLYKPIREIEFKV